MSARRGPAASLSDVEDLLRDPATYAQAEVLPGKPKSGRPRSYPAYMWVVYRALLSTWGSARQVEAELAHPVVWNLMRKTVKERFPDDPTMWLPEEPMRRHHHDYARRYLNDPAVQERLLQVHREHAVDLSIEVGLLDPDGPGSFTHPDPSRVIQADGKVITPLFRAKPGDKRLDKATGELVTKRHDPDACHHVQGDDEHVWGNKFVITSTRSNEDRVILDVASSPKGVVGGEAAVALGSFERLAPLAPGVQAVVYDMALRGKHMNVIMGELGWLAITKVVAKASGTTKKRRRVGAYIPNGRHIEVRKVKGEDGLERTLSIYAEAGAAGIGRMTDSGDVAFVATRRFRTHRNSNKGGGFRWYNEYEVPTEYGGGTFAMRLVGNEEDTKAGLNRAENLRAIPPSDPDFKRLFARRNDTESINRALDDTLFLRRAHSVGQAGQLADLLGFALLVNARTRGRLRARERLKTAA